LNNADSLTEQSITETFREIISQWSWSCEAAHLMEKDWRKWLEWKEQPHSPGARMEGWRPEMIDCSSAWTIELWVKVNGEMVACHPTIDRSYTDQK
jgi:hypothetical protein